MVQGFEFWVLGCRTLLPGVWSLEFGVWSLEFGDAAEAAR
jgi:hypothetical protein